MDHHSLDIVQHHQFGQIEDWQPLASLYCRQNKLELFIIVRILDSVTMIFSLVYPLDCFVLLLCQLHFQFFLAPRF